MIPINNDKVVYVIKYALIHTLNYIQKGMEKIIIDRNTGWK